MYLSRSAISLLIFACLGMGTSCTSAQNSPPPKQDSAYFFDSSKYKDQPKKGFLKLLKLIKKSESEKAPPEVTAGLYLQAAMLRRPSRSDIRDKKWNPEPTIKLLKNVVGKPDVYLANADSALQYKKCAYSLFSTYIHLNQASPKVLTKPREAYANDCEAMLLSVIKDIESAPAVTSYNRKAYGLSLRLNLSDFYIRKTPEKAVTLLKSSLKNSEILLTNPNGILPYAMGVRQQSMFLMDTGRPQESFDLIDQTCEKIKAAKGPNESLKLRARCMLRGKHFVNFSRTPESKLAIAGWAKYVALRDEVLAYRGEEADKAAISALNMNRLATTMNANDYKERFHKLLQSSVALYQSLPKKQQDRRSAFYLTETLSYSQRKLGNDASEATKKLIDQTRQLIKDAANQ